MVINRSVEEGSKEVKDKKKTKIKIKRKTGAAPYPAVMK
jgi:hypothetical protein